MNQSAAETHRPLRKRLKRREIPGGVRFITFSCHRRLPLFRNPAIAGVFVKSLAAAKQRHAFHLFAWVVMPEHVHLLVRPAHDLHQRTVLIPLDRSLLWLKLSVSKQVIPKWKRLGARVLPQLTCPDGSIRFWQKGGGFDRNVRNLNEFQREVRYIHHNPVERGLAERAEDWRWSNIHWWMGVKDGQVECDPPPDPTIAWHHWTGFK